MIRQTATFTMMFLFANALNISAAEQDLSAKDQAPLSAAVTLAARDAEPTTSLWSLSQQPKRPAVLPALYGTYAAMQVLDVMSTKRAIAAGSHESNPLLGTGKMSTTIVLKAATGVATYYLVEKAWKKNRVGAIVLMAVMNGATAAVVVHNNRNASRK